MCSNIKFRGIYRDIKQNKELKIFYICYNSTWINFEGFMVGCVIY